MFITWIAKILAALNANARPGEIGAAVAAALLLALIPGGNLLFIGLLAAAFFVRLNTAMLLVFLAIFAWPVRALDGVTDALGYAVLTWPPLAGLFTALANVPLVPWTAFNHTRVMGGLLLGVVLFVPVAALFSFLVRYWRTEARERLMKSKPVQAFLRWPLVSSVASFFGKVWSVAKEFA